MAHELHRRRARLSILGYAVVLLGAVLFVTGCYLPYQGFPPPAQGAISLWQLLTSPVSRPADAGAPFYLFGGVATVAAVAIIALVRGGRGPVLAALLIGAVIAWSLTWVGALLRASFGFSLEVGYWLQAASIGVVIIGTILVGVGMRSEVKDSHDRYANVERTDTDAE